MCKFLRISNKIVAQIFILIGHFVVATYKRQVKAKNDEIQTIGKLDRLELLNSKTDRWPCLFFRKRLESAAIHINMLALNII